MMTNLFSTFDPATSSSLSLNWSSTFLIMIIFPMMFWLAPNRNMIFYMTFMETLHKEFKMLLMNKHQGLTHLLITLFMFILINNMMGLLPYIFTSSSHLSFALTMALPVWLSTILFGWISKPQEMFAHLVPVGTPSILMPFMVIIETISNLIRPGSLAVRLTANMIAGHLLMSLLGGNMEKESIAMPLIYGGQIMLMMFEIAVAIIQAYVFSVLSTLYSSEVLYEQT